MRRALPETSDPLPAMKTLALLCALSAFSGMIFAQEDTARHRALHKEINEGAASMKTSKAEAADGEAKFKLTAWSEGGVVRKIVATGADGGTTFTEYYLDGGKPVFVFDVFPDGEGGKIEERLYFRDGEIFKWLTSVEGAPPFHAEDYEATTEMHVRRCALFLKALGGDAAEANTLKGKFLGIEQGDYTHWRMSAGDGEERSFFVLQTTPAIDKVLEDPAAFKGKACRVTWKTSVENLEEAGGKTEIDVLVSVEWVE